MEVVAAVISKNDKFVFLKRADGTWTFPSGKVEVGEELNEALIREVKEETSLDIYIHTYIGCKDIEDRGLHFLGCTHSSGDLILTEPDNFTQVDWKTVDEILDIVGGKMFSPVKDYLINYNNRRERYLSLKN